MQPGGVALLRMIYRARVGPRDSTPDTVLWKLLNSAAGIDCFCDFCCACEAVRIFRTYRYAVVALMSTAFLCLVTLTTQVMLLVMWSSVTCIALLHRTKNELFLH